MNDRTRFGEFGGRYVPEVLMPALIELEASYDRYRNDQEFLSELAWYYRHYGGRPTPLYFARRLTARAGGAKIYLKREDLCHGGAHKFNNVMGQGLLCKRMGKRRIIAETGAGQHGTATAMAAAVLGLRAEIYMGAEDVARQRMNVYRMRLMGAEVHEVEAGSRTLKDAINEAMRDWAANVRDTYYLFGTAAGPHPYPTIVRDFQSIIGREIKEQLKEQEGKAPDLLVACVGGGSNAIGTFHPFIDDPNVRLLGAEAAGCGVNTGRHSCSLSAGEPGVLHGAKSYLLQDGHGMISPTHSIAAGLDYPAVGPEHAHLGRSRRVEYLAVTDEEALAAFHLLSETEGIIPALESAHAIAHSVRLASKMDKDQIIIVNLSGRGDKDVNQVAELEGEL